MTDRLTKFLQIVFTSRMRSGAVPKVWAVEYRQALSDGLVSIGWGGVLDLTDEGRTAANIHEERTPKT